MKLKTILNEAVEHEIALKLISNLIKNSKWANKVFLAGGAVRDSLIGKNIKDIDITVAAPNGGIEFATWLAKKLKIYRHNSNPVVYPKFGTAKITLRGIKIDGIDLSQIDIECVMTRKEKYAKNNRKPEVEYGTPEQDVERRDLTVNSLLKDLTTGEIKDLTGKGLSDIKNGIIRTPLDPNIIFKEDPLRMLRAIRFAVKYNWKLPYSMIKALKSNANMLQHISAERIQDELNKILISKSPATGIRLLQITGLNKYIAPELDYLINLKQNKYHKWDANKHTLEVLKKTPADLITRLAALFHDIGKFKTKEVIDNEVHFFTHEDVGADIARDILKKLKYPNDIINGVYKIIQNHMRLKSFDNTITDKTLRRLQNDLGDHLEKTLDVIDADNKSHGPNNWSYNKSNQISNIRNRMKNLNIKKFDKLKLPIDGNEIMKMFNIKQGPIVGKLLAVVKDEYLNNPKITKYRLKSVLKQKYKELN